MHHLLTAIHARIGTTPFTLQFDMFAQHPFSKSDATWTYAHVKRHSSCTSLEFDIILSSLISYYIQLKHFVSSQNLDILSLSIQLKNKFKQNWDLSTFSQKFLSLLCE